MENQLENLSPEEIKKFQEDFSAFLNEKSVSFGTFLQKEPIEISGKDGKTRIVYVDVPVTVIKKVIKSPIQKEDLAQ